MAKKKLKIDIVAIVSTLCCVLAVVMFLLPMINYHLEGSMFLASGVYDAKYDGFDLAFGNEEVKGTFVASILGSAGDPAEWTSSIKGSSLVMIAFFLLVASVLTSAVQFIVKTKLKGLFNFITGALLIGAIVVLFMGVLNDFYVVNEIEEASRDEYYKLMYGFFVVIGLAAVPCFFNFKKIAK